MLNVKLTDAENKDELIKLPKGLSTEGFLGLIKGYDLGYAVRNERAVQEVKILKLQLKLLEEELHEVKLHK